MRSLMQGQANELGFCCRGKHLEAAERKAAKRGGDQPPPLLQQSRVETKRYGLRDAQLIAIGVTGIQQEYAFEWNDGARNSQQGALRRFDPGVPDGLEFCWRREVGPGGWQCIGDHRANQGRIEVNANEGIRVKDPCCLEMNEDL